MKKGIVLLLGLFLSMEVAFGEGLIEIEEGSQALNEGIQKIEENTTGNNYKETSLIITGIAIQDNKYIMLSNGERVEEGSNYRGYLLESIVEASNSFEKNKAVFKKGEFIKSFKVGEEILVEVR